MRMALSNEGQGLEAGQAGHAFIGKHEVEKSALQRRNKFFARGSAQGDAADSGVLEDPAHALDIVVAQVEIENMNVCFHNHPSNHHNGNSGHQPVKIEDSGRSCAGSECGLMWDLKKACRVGRGAFETRGVED